MLHYFAEAELERAGVSPSAFETVSSKNSTAVNRVKVKKVNQDKRKVLTLHYNVC